MRWSGFYFQTFNGRNNSGTQSVGPAGSPSRAVAGASSMGQQKQQQHSIRGNGADMIDSNGSRGQSYGSRGASLMGGRGTGKKDNASGGAGSLQNAAYMAGPTMASVFASGRDLGQGIPGLHSQSQAVSEQQQSQQDHAGPQQQQQQQAVRMPPPGPSAPYANGNIQTTPAGAAQKVQQRNPGVGDSPGLDRDFPHLALINDLLE